MKPNIGLSSIHTNIPSIDDIKSENIGNIRLINQGNQNAHLRIRMQINKKSVHQNIYFRDYNSVSHTIVAALVVKKQMEDTRNKTQKIMNNEKLIKGEKKIPGLSLKIDRGYIKFAINIFHNGLEYPDSVKADYYDFEGSFNNALNKYTECKKKIGSGSVFKIEQEQFSYYLEYYRKKYQELKDRLGNKFKRSKNTNTPAIQGDGKLPGLTIRVLKGKPVFYYNISKNGNIVHTSKSIDPENFNGSFNDALRKYKKSIIAVGYEEMTEYQKELLYISCAYYKGIYDDKCREINTENQKNKLIEKGLINKEGIILLFSVSTNGEEKLTYKGNKKNSTRVLNQENIDYFIENFILSNDLDLQGDIHRWLRDNNKPYKLRRTKKEK